MSLLYNMFCEGSINITIELCPFWAHGKHDTSSLAVSHDITLHYCQVGISREIKTIVELLNGSLVITGWELIEITGGVSELAIIQPAARCLGVAFQTVPLTGNRPQDPTLIARVRHILAELKVFSSILQSSAAVFLQWL